MEKRKFWCILGEIDPLYDVIIRGQNVRKSHFQENEIDPEAMVMKAFFQRVYDLKRGAF